MIEQHASIASQPESKLKDRLEECRRRRNMTQQEVVDAMKGFPDSRGVPTSISRAAYAQWETGLTTPAVDRIAAFALAVGADPAYIAFGGSYGGKALDDDVAWVGQLDGPEVWGIPIGELRQLGADADKLKTVAVDSDIDDTPIRRGSQVIIDTSISSVKSPGLYAYKLGSSVYLASMVQRPTRGATTVVVKSGGSTFEAGPEDLTILGRAVRAWVSV